MKKVISLLTVFFLLLSCVFAVTAAEDTSSSVTFEIEGKTFTFAPGSEYSATDLFTNFKGCMPGDVRTQKVHVRYASKSGSRVEIFMKALGPTEEKYTEFLSQMNLKVEAKQTALDKVKEFFTGTLFEATAEKTAQLTDWVSLGKFEPTGEMDLDVTLEVPITLSNEFMNMEGKLDWLFKVVEIEDPPHTGDNTHLFAYVAAAAVSAAGLAVVLNKRKKETD